MGEVPYADQIRGIMAIFAINASMAFGVLDEQRPSDPEQVAAAALEAANELLESSVKS